MHVDDRGYQNLGMSWMLRSKINLVCSCLGGTHFQWREPLQLKEHFDSTKHRSFIGHSPDFSSLA